MGSIKNTIGQASLNIRRRKSSTFFIIANCAIILFSITNIIVSYESINKSISFVIGFSVLLNITVILMVIKNWNKFPKYIHTHKYVIRATDPPEMKQMIMLCQLNNIPYYDYIADHEYILKLATNEDLVFVRLSV